MQQYTPATPLTDSPLTWIMEWRTTIVIVVAGMLAWGLWWREAMRPPRASGNTTAARYEAKLQALQEEDEEHIEAVSRAKRSLDLALSTPLTLEEETVALHNLRFATAK
jgi:hypothetical protein